MATKIILDCDPGHDDAIAILLALGSPQLDLLGISTIGGNQSLEKVTYNARALCELAGRAEVPVVAGCSRPLLREPQNAAGVHGETGLDGVDLPEPSRPLSGTHAVSWLIDTIMGHEPKSITMVATGPLTNLAVAVRIEPRIVERISQLVVMGGAYGVGNVTPVAEFNIWCDPEAAQMVFGEPWPLTMIGLDTTHQALFTSQVQQMITSANPRLAPAVNGMMNFYRQAYQASGVFVDPPIHDACAVAYVIDPGLITTRPAPVRVELRGEFTYGMTVTDRRAANPDCSSRIGARLDAPRFWELVADAIANLG